MSTKDPSFQTKVEAALRGIDFMMANYNLSQDEALKRVPVDDALLPHVLAEIKRRESIRIIDPSALIKPHEEWLPDTPRDHWYYWPRLRSYLVEGKNWPLHVVKTIDRATDKILGAMENPQGADDFDTRGLVVGYVQSGKTANYSGLIAKAADAGYRLFIVLSGIHDSLRLQTQRRLGAELVGKVNGKWIGVGRPASRKEWITLTGESDFNPGEVGTATLNMEKPALMVVKKNARVLEKVIGWLDDLPDEVRRTLPCLVVDDEADQASINTGGNRPEDYDEADEDADESPTKINLCIRKLLTRFSRIAYVAYTATPYANVLIEHDADDREGKRDLYPASFIMSLPPPEGYYGAERVFGSPDGSKPGMDIVRIVPEEEIRLLVPAKRKDIPLFSPEITTSLQLAIDDFVLAGAARIRRGDRSQPATMLIHTSYSTTVQGRLTSRVSSYVEQLSDDWHYSKKRKQELATRLRKRWESDFRPVTRSENATLDVTFEDIEPGIATFLKDLPVLEINNVSADQLDYQRDPDLKVIVVGGNRLSRGLTLEGLLVSYYVRASRTYDTLMQMGRWFGFRDGYADLTRIYTTRKLRDWFRDLADIEEELRDEIARYEREGLTPLEMGTKIKTHPAMMVTSPLKMKGVEKVQVSFAGQVAQTITFPLYDRLWLRRNLDTTKEFVKRLGKPDSTTGSRPGWYSVPASEVLWFLEHYQMDPGANRIQTEPLRQFISAQNEYGELTSWVVGVMGLKRPDSILGTWDLGVPGIPPINLIERTQLKNRETASLGVIVSPEDEGLGLSEEQRRRAERLRAESEDKISRGRSLRACRDTKQGLLLIYPISRNSGHHGECAKGREPLYVVRDDGEHIIGVAFSFPDSKTPATVEYVVGSVGTRDF
jgi:hypothetical protein